MCDVSFEHVTFNYDEYINLSKSSNRARIQRNSVINKVRTEEAAIRVTRNGIDKDSVGSNNQRSTGDGDAVYNIVTPVSSACNKDVISKDKEGK